MLTWRSIRLSGPLVGSMILAVCAVAALAYLDAQRESEAALADFTHDQETLASALAADVSHRLASRATQSPVSARELLEGLRSAERPLATRVVLLPPGQRELVGIDGRTVPLDPIREALLAGKSAMRLSRQEAAVLQLPARTALAGLARAEAAGSDAGTWGVVAVASAEHERDREARARWRLILSVVTAAGLVVLFGGLALRKQRHELSLQHQLELQRMRQEADERLQTASKAATLGTLAMGVAHEISTPLGVITVRAEQLLPKLASDERGSTAIRAIVEQCERISQIIRGLLGLARGDTPAARNLDPQAVVEGALAMVAHRFAKAGVNVAYRGSHDLPAILGDPRLLEQALVNLLLNACDASPAEGKVVVDSVVQNDQLIISVADEGVGISPQDVDRALRPFYTTKPKGSGTGLGLAVAYEIVSSHRGSLSLAPAEPCGTRATIKLPLRGEAHV